MYSFVLKLMFHIGICCILGYVNPVVSPYVDIPIAGDGQGCDVAGWKIADIQTLFFLSIPHKQGIMSGIPDRCIRSGECRSLVPSGTLAETFAADVISKKITVSNEIDISVVATVDIVNGIS